MGEAKRRKKLDPAFGRGAQNDISVQFGRIVRGDDVGLPQFSMLLEFSAIRGGVKIRGYAHPSIDERGGISIRWVCAGPHDRRAQALIDLCCDMSQHSKRAAEIVKEHLDSCELIIVN